MKVIKIYIISVLFVVTCLSEVHGYDLFLDKEVEVTFRPFQGFFLIEVSSQETTRAQAVLLPVQGEVNDSHQEAAPEKRRWLVGTKLKLPDEVKHITYSIVLSGDKNRYAFISPQKLDLSSKELFSGSIDNLREHLLQRKEVWLSWKTQVKTQEQSLLRLRSDADTIANLGRIIEAQEEVKRLGERAQDLDQDIANMHAFMRTIKNQNLAKNLVGRENQLSKQLSELAESAKGAERAEIQRRSLAAKSLQDKLTLLEEARETDLDSLQRELIALRKRLRDLEREN